MTSAQSTEACGYGQGIASGCVAVRRGTNEQTSAFEPANVEWIVGGRCTMPDYGWYARIGNANGHTVPSHPTTSNGECAGRRRTNASSFLTRTSLGPSRGGV